MGMYVQGHHACDLDYHLHFTNSPNSSLKLRHVFVLKGQKALLAAVERMKSHIAVQFHN